MKTREQVMTEGVQLTKAAKIIARKVLELRADLINLGDKPPQHVLDAIYRDCHHLEAHADELFIDLGKLA